MQSHQEHSQEHKDMGHKLSVIHDHKTTGVATSDFSKLNNSRCCCFSKEHNARFLTWKERMDTGKKDIKFKWEYKLIFISTQLSLN
jgi:hypothetical protein